MYGKQVRPKFLSVVLTCLFTFFEIFYSHFFSFFEWFFQMRWISLIVRILVLPIQVLLAWLKKLDEKISQPRFQVRGGCHHNGACCERLFLMEGPFLSWPILRQLTHFWMTKIYPFEFLEHSMMNIADGEYYRMVSCRNLVDGKCREYWLRPRLCRVWPTSEDEKPTLLFEGCGFWIEDRENPEAGDVAKRRLCRRKEGRDSLLKEWKK